MFGVLRMKPDIDSVSPFAHFGYLPPSPSRRRFHMGFNPASHHSFRHLIPSPFDDKNDCPNWVVSSICHYPALFPSRRRFHMEFSPASHHSSRPLIPCLFDDKDDCPNWAVPTVTGSLPLLLPYRVLPRIPSLIPSSLCYSMTMMIFIACYR
jgi:hypothetical protein